MKLTRRGRVAVDLFWAVVMSALVVGAFVAEGLWL